MCCIALTAFGLGPRIALALLWIFGSRVGLLFLPWTTLFYVLAWGAVNGVSGWGWVLLNGIVYTSWSSHCDIRPYTGWIMGYDQNNLSQVSVLNVTPNGNDGAFWTTQ